MTAGLLFCLRQNKRADMWYGMRENGYVEWLRYDRRPLVLLGQNKRADSRSDRRANGHVERVGLYRLPLVLLSKTSERIRDLAGGLMGTLRS